MSWLLSNARIDDGEQLYDIHIVANQIKTIHPTTSGVSGIKTENHWNLAGKVLLPGLIETHAHLDKTYTQIENSSGDLEGAIAAMREVQAIRTEESIYHRAERGLRQAIRMGVCYMRTHVDLSKDDDSALKALLALRNDYSDMIDLQLIALGDLSNANGIRRMSSALDRGADGVGGAPALSNDPHTFICNAIDLARKYDCLLDLHADENSNPNSPCLELMAEKLIAEPLNKSVSASHCCSLAFVEPTQQQQICARVAEAGINVITLPACNLILIGGEQQPQPRGCTAIKALSAAGVNVATGADNVQDPFNPFGNYDPLSSAQLTAQVAKLTSEKDRAKALNMVTGRAALALGLPQYGLVAGNQANLVVLDTKKYREVITAPPLRLATFYNGLPVVRTSIETGWIQKPQQGRCYG